MRRFNSNQNQHNTITHAINPPILRSPITTTSQPNIASNEKAPPSKGIKEKPTSISALIERYGVMRSQRDKSNLATGTAADKPTMIIG